MLNNLKEDFQKLINSNIFKDEHGYLTSCFFMSDIDKIKEQSWQFDFYNKSDDTITSYKENQIINNKSKINKEKGKTINELKIKEVNIGFKEAYEEAKEHITETPTKIITVIQQLEEPTYNITFFTNTLKLVNVKINTITKDIISKTEENLLNFKAD